MNQDEWEKCIKEWMHNGGWECDRDDEKTLGFSFIEGDHHWIRDYCKKERRFVQFDGNQRVNLVVSKEK
jgi:signal-transduction protein with cAMP-binding, CBS, and nucleotidyltransferase domain